MNSSKTPILFLIFNRPSESKRVFEAIKSFKPSRLYIAADGPRPGVEADQRNCAEVRCLADHVDWPCQIQTLFRESNLGCKTAISEAITWFFQHEDEGIILEDDCIANPSFFRFAETLLSMYRHDRRIMAISGDKFVEPSPISQQSSYRFSAFVHVWGWATWKRAWDLYDLEMTDWPALSNEDWLEPLLGSQAAAAYWKSAFNAVYRGAIDTWDYQWIYSCWKNSGLSILPNHNLVSNIGFGEAATHTTDQNATWANVKTHELEFPMRHPKNVIRDYAADANTLDTVYAVHSRKASRKRRQTMFHRLGRRIKASLRSLRRVNF